MVRTLKVARSSDIFVGSHSPSRVLLLHLDYLLSSPYLYIFTRNYHHRLLYKSTNNNSSLNLIWFKFQMNKLNKLLNKFPNPSTSLTNKRIIRLRTLILPRVTEPRQHNLSNNHNSQKIFLY